MTEIKLFLHVQYNTYQTVNVNEIASGELENFIKWCKSKTQTPYVLNGGVVFPSVEKINNFKIYEIDTILHPIEEIVKAQRDSLKDITTSEDDVYGTFGTDVTKDIVNSIGMNICKNVLIIHGHDENLLLRVKDFLRTIKLNPIILKEQASRGDTIIEKFENISDKASFAIALYTACDIGCEKDGTPKSRARQNVVFEHGFFMGKYGRMNVASIVEDGVEIPSDIGGVIYINKNNWQIELATELRSAGFEINMNELISTY